MGFWRSRAGLALIVAAAAALLLFCFVGLRVYWVTHPERVIEPLGELSVALTSVEEVRFASADGVELGGWLLEGVLGKPAVVLCHDLGKGKASLLNLALALQKAGYTALVFDFRAHGESQGGGSGVGTVEERDVAAAIEFLLSREAEEGRESGKPVVGLYGVGMGAHAAVLAAENRQEVRVLVLDALYPDASQDLVRRVYGGWTFGEEYLRFLPQAVFSVSQRGAADSPGAAEVLPRLIGRDLLLVEPAGDTSRAREIRDMYETIPVQADSEGNLVTLPSMGTGALYGEEGKVYQQRVTRFFETRL